MVSTNADINEIRLYPASSTRLVSRRDRVAVAEARRFRAVDLCGPVLINPQKQRHFSVLLLNHRVTTNMKWTPMRLAEHHGVDVTYYTPRPAPWHKLPEYGAVNFALVLGLSAFFYGAVRLPKGIVRTLAAWAGIIVFILAPSRYGFGRSGLVSFVTESCARRSRCTD